MNCVAFNQFCKSLPMSTFDIQWRGSHVWKIGGKVFAIGRWKTEKFPGVTFKVSDIAFECLKNQSGIRPAPYFASRGMKWLQHYNGDVLSDDDLKLYLTESHRIVSLGLTKKKKKALGLNDIKTL